MSRLATEFINTCFSDDLPLCDIAVIGNKPSDSCVLGEQIVKVKDFPIFV